MERLEHRAEQLHLVFYLYFKFPELLEEREDQLLADLEEVRYLMAILAEPAACPL
jgi:hypothetical protein